MNENLEDKEPHPASQSAMRYLISLGHEKLAQYAEAFASCAIESNRLGEICIGTLNRIFKATIP